MRITQTAETEHEKRERQQREREAMRQAIATYTGPISKCPPGVSTNVLPRRRVRRTEKDIHVGEWPERLAHQLIVHRSIIRGARACATMLRVVCWVISNPNRLAALRNAASQPGRKRSCNSIMIACVLFIQSKSPASKISFSAPSMSSLRRSIFSKPHSLIDRRDGQPLDRGALAIRRFDLEGTRVILLVCDDDRFWPMPHRRMNSANALIVPRVPQEHLIVARIGLYRDNIRARKGRCEE